jgi:ATP-binding cassette subfamily F protein uup
MVAVLTLSGIEKSFNDKKLLRGVSLVVNEGERVGLLGPNGSGKSTLLAILSGRMEPDAGERTLQRGLKLGYFEQEPSIDLGHTAREVVRAGAVEREAILRELARIAESLAHPEIAPRRMGSLLTRHAELEAKLERLGGHDVEHRIEAMLHDLGLADLDKLCGQLSGGERRRVALARLFISAPDFLLLDEPTNHLDAIVTEWLEDRLLETEIPFLMVTHDRYFLDRVVHRIVEIDRGELVSYDGGYGEYLLQRAERMEVERKTESSRLNMLRRETTWMRRGAPARSTKQKARIGRFYAIVDAAPEARGDDLEFRIPSGPRLGSKVIELHAASAKRGERIVIAPLDLDIGPGDRVGIVGPNGAGKSTLLHLCAGFLAPASGRVVIGETVRFASIDQQRTDLDPEKTVIEEVAGQNEHVAVGDRTLRIEGFLEQFLFPGPMKYAKVGLLSGGEKNRVLLAKLLCQGGNVILLDEPTNDLDLASLRTLEEALVAFAGSVIVVSHDRWFLDRVATRILYLDGSGQVRRHEGDLSSLLDKLHEEKEAAAKEPVPARRAQDAGSSRTNRAARESDSSEKRPAKKKALASWHQREYDVLPDKIAAAEAELESLDAKLADPALYSGPKSELERVNARRAALKSEIAVLYARWEELEALQS